MIAFVFVGALIAGARIGRYAGGGEASDHGGVEEIETASLAGPPQDRQNDSGAAGVASGATVAGEESSEGNDGQG